MFKIKNKNFLINLLNFLRIKYLTSGIEISDNAIRYFGLDRSKIINVGIRLMPGIISGGKILNYDLFKEALLELKRKVLGEKRMNKTLSVSVCLSSVNVYIQNFSLPLILEEDIEKSIKLNIAMIAPDKSEKIYSSWQIIKEDRQVMRVDILSVFVDKNIIDLLSKALLETNFNVRSIEPQPISLIRFLCKKVKNFYNDKNYLVLNIDDSGIKSLIIKGGSLYFYYFSPWLEIMKDKKEISWYDFEIFLTHHLRQVINFYNSKWNEIIDGLFLISSSFKEEIKEIIRNNFSLSILEINYEFQDKISIDWITSYGVYLRSEIPPHKDKEISLLGVGAAEKFIEHQIIRFFEFWKLFWAGALCLIILELGAGLVFLKKTNHSLITESAHISSSGQIREIKNLQQKIEQFNKTVSIINKIENDYFDKQTILQKINQHLKENNIILNSLSFDNQTKRIKMFLLAKNEEDISRFKKSLEGDNLFYNINLPFSEIKPYDEGLTFSVSFSMNFSKIK